jgi:RNA polymerase sigma-70 factor, ECF subfamily
MRRASSLSTDCMAIEQYLDGLYGYALMLTRNHAEAEDLAQETYLRAYKAKGRLAHYGNIKGWLFTILRNIWLNELRSRRTRPETAIPDWNEAVARISVPGQKNAHDQYVANVERERVRAAIQQLAVEFREVIVLREYEEMSYQEMADVLNCPAGTVMSRLSRARAKLEGLLSTGGQSSTSVVEVNSK